MSAKFKKTNKNREKKLFSIQFRRKKEKSVEDKRV